MPSDRTQQTRRLPLTVAALRELAGPDPAARRALYCGLAQGLRAGLSGAALLVAGLFALERWHQAHAAAQG